MTFTGCPTEAEASAVEVALTNLKAITTTVRTQASRASQPKPQEKAASPLAAILSFASIPLPLFQSFLTQLLLLLGWKWKLRCPLSGSLRAVQPLQSHSSRVGAKTAASA